MNGFKSLSSFDFMQTATLSLGIDFDKEPCRSKTGKDGGNVWKQIPVCFAIC